ncbi:MAG: hypothetical protein QM737_22110 [Ferruginibacter sp.]
MNENDIDKIPKHRAFSLYVILICGIVISLLGTYMHFSLDPGKEYVYFDGETYLHSKPFALIFILVGLVICIFPAYHLYKGNHKVK